MPVTRCLYFLANEPSPRTRQGCPRVLFSFVPVAQRGSHTRAADILEPPFYSCSLLPEMQRTLAAIADIETRREIERERIANGQGRRAKFPQSKCRPSA